MAHETAVIVVVANGEVSVDGCGDVEVVVVNFDDIRDYETPRGAVEALLERVGRLPEGDGAYRNARRDALYGLAHAEPMTR